MAGQYGNQYDLSSYTPDIWELMKKYTPVGIAGTGLGEGAGRIQQAYAAHQAALNAQQNRFAPGVRRQLENYAIPSAPAPAPAPSASATPTMPPAPYNPPVRATASNTNKNVSVSNAVPSTNAYAQGEVVNPSIAGGANPAAQAPATTKGLFDRDAMQKDAEMQFALGVGGLGAQQADAQRQMDYADEIGKKDNKRMDWASQASRALAGIGNAYGRMQGQEAMDASRRLQGTELQKLKYSIDRLRRGENPDTLDPRWADQQGF